MDNYLIYNLFNKLNWNAVFKKLLACIQDIYFTPEYYSLYEKNNEGTAQCFVFEKDGEIALYPFLLNSINELGYELDDEYFDIQGAYGYNGVISSTYTRKFITDFYEEFNEYCTDNNIVAEFTRFHPLLNNLTFSENHFEIYVDRETVWLDLTQHYDTIWQKEYSGNNRNMIRKAEKMGVTSYISEDKSDYLSFVDLYHETMKNVGASDYFYFDESYFQNIRKELKNHHHLIVSKVDDEFAGAMILFIYGDYAHYHLSARKSAFGKYAINNHFLDHAVKIAMEKGCKKFHFGGGLSGDLKDPLFKFKSGFSQKSAIFKFGKKVHNEKIYKIIMNQWKDNYPGSFNINYKKLLGYREI